MTKNAGGCDMGLRWTMSMGRLIHVWFTLTKFDRRGVVWRSVKKFKWLSESLKRNQVDVTSIQKSALIVETTSSVLTSRCYFSPTVHLCVTSVQYFIPSAHFIHKVHLTPGAGLYEVPLCSRVPSIDNIVTCMSTEVHLSLYLAKLCNCCQICIWFTQ